jgi:hypothetical protein
MTGSVTFSTGIGGDGSTVTDDDNATTGLRDGGWRTRFVPCFTNQVSIANYVVTKANEAAASQTAAGSSATAAAAAYDSFDDRYLGAKSSNPTVDNDGNALLTGALYWNTVSNEMRVYSGSAWVAAYIPSSGYLALSGGTMTGAITFAAGQTISGYLPTAGGTMTGAITFAAAQFGTNVNTFLSTPSSANLAAALTDETGSGVNVFNNTPTLITPILGTPQSGNLANCTFPTLNQNTSGTAAGLSATLAITSGGTGSTSTTYCSLTTNVSGTLPVANGGTGTTTPALVAGTNVSISGTWPNQTINASGGTSLTGVTGATNTALGVSALTSITTGTNNTATGVSALSSNTTATDNTAMGYSALVNNTTGSFNVAVGRECMQNNTTADNNTALGSNALGLNTTGTQNTAIGRIAIYRNTTGYQNSAVGYQALYNNTTGINNLAVGNAALQNNTTGSSNVGIGASCTSSTTTVSNEVNIYNGTVTARFQGSDLSWSFVSDIRDKTNIVDLEIGLNFINKLQPRKFEWDLRHTNVDKGRVASGFIAQEVLSVLEQEDALFTGIVDTNDSEKYMLAQTNLIPILVNAIKELSAELTALKLKVGN